MDENRKYPIGWTRCVSGVPLWLGFVDLFAAFTAGIYACAIVEGGVSACAVGVIAVCAAASGGGHLFAALSLWAWRNKKRPALRSSAIQVERVGNQTYRDYTTAAGKNQVRRVK